MMDYQNELGLGRGAGRDEGADWIYNNLRYTESIHYCGINTASEKGLIMLQLSSSEDAVTSQYH